MVLPKVWLRGFDWTFMKGSAFVLRLNFCAKIPPLRQAAERLLNDTADYKQTTELFNFDKIK